jgi:hypothetical protein
MNKQNPDISNYSLEELLIVIDQQGSALVKLTELKNELYEVLSNLLDEVSGVPMRAVDCDQDAVEKWMKRAYKVIDRAKGETK